MVALARRGNDDRNEERGCHILPRVSSYIVLETEEIDGIRPMTQGSHDP